MAAITISTFELIKMFPDQETARVYLESRLWPNGPRCPVCGLGEKVTARRDGYYRCRQCAEDFTVRTGTIFERSHVPLHKWLMAMYLLVTARKGISSLQLSKEIGITQKSAWFVLHRLREACGPDFAKLTGIVEIDETYCGGKAANKHAHKRTGKRGPAGKQAVLAMRERGGRTVAMPIEGTDIENIHRQVFEHVEIGATLHTDEAAVYGPLGGLFFNHASINHSAGEFVRGDVTTNGVESVFAALKRGLIGVYHHASAKHLGRYVDEFAFRLNDGNVRRDTVDRLDSMIAGCAGKRLTYEGLIH
jgi:transposase-like protein